MAPHQRQTGAQRRQHAPQVPAHEEDSRRVLHQEHQQQDEAARDQGGEQDREHQPLGARLAAQVAAEGEERSGDEQREQHGQYQRDRAEPQEAREEAEGPPPESMAERPIVAARQDLERARGGDEADQQLTVAADLAKLGHKVTIFESLHVAGGVLMYGISEFRLPKKIVQNEVEYIKSLGIEIRLDSTVGMLATLQEIFQEGYDSIFIARELVYQTFYLFPEKI